MIKEMTPLSIAEAKEIYKKAKTEKDLNQYFKKFEKLKLDKAEKLIEEIKKLEMVKVKDSHIKKITDLLPEDAEDLNKIFADISLDKNETETILEIVKKYK
jgi:DNA-directed RNA polymerase subunit F